jgi:hypothetical protein
MKKEEEIHKDRTNAYGEINVVLYELTPLPSTSTDYLSYPSQTLTSHIKH